MFITTLQSDPLFYVSVVVSVVISIVLHELAHGWAAIWQGDDTPIRRGHMNVNPLVHMGGFSLILLFLVGFSYGQMPVNPSRFKGRYGDAIVSLAGPAMNLLLALLGLTVLGLWQQMGSESLSQSQINAQHFLWFFGRTNIMLCLFNLIPIPPLDGSSILATFNKDYARFTSDPSKQQVMMFLFMGAIFLGGGVLRDFSVHVSRLYLSSF